jgi:hypothetical protein
VSMSSASRVCCSVNGLDACLRLAQGRGHVVRNGFHSVHAILPGVSPAQVLCRKTPAESRASRCAAMPCGRAPMMAVTLPGGRRSVEGERTGHMDGASAGPTVPCCVLAVAHVSCRLAPGRGQTPSGVSPSPSPPWGSTWAVSCGHATARPSVQRSPGAGVTGDVQRSIRRRGA